MHTEMTSETAEEAPSPVRHSGVCAFDCGKALGRNLLKFNGYELIVLLMLLAFGVQKF